MRREVRVLRDAGLLGPRGALALGAGLLAQRHGIGAVLRYAVARHGSAVALTSDTETITYAALDRRVTALTERLGTDVSRGERIGVPVRNDVDSIIALFTAARLGLSVWPLDARQPPAALSGVVVDHGLQLLLSVGPPPINGETVGRAAAFELTRCTSLRSRADRPNLVVLTGGTTGTPKAAGRRASAWAMWVPFSALVADVGLTRGSSAYLTAPLHHGFGLSSLLVGMVLGSTLRLTTGVDAETVATTIRSCRPDVLVAVPTILRRLLAHDPHAYDEVGTVVSGSAPLHSDVARAILSGPGPRLFHLFGTSEAGFCALATPEMLRDHPDTIGRAIPGVRLRIVNDAHQEVPAGTSGALQSRGRAATGHGWIDTGDIAYRDQDGLLHLDGRSDRVIQSGGVSVAPAELERALCAHPAIDDSAVVPVPDPDLGQRLAAFVVSRPGHELDVEGLHGWLRGQVAHALRPRWIRPVPELPLTPALKVDRQKLERLARQHD